MWSSWGVSDCQLLCPLPLTEVDRLSPGVWWFWVVSSPLQPTLSVGLLYNLDWRQVFSEVFGFAFAMSPGVVSLEALCMFISPRWRFPNHSERRNCYSRSAWVWLHAFKFSGDILYPSQSPGQKKGQASMLSLVLVDRRFPSSPFHWRDIPL